AGVENHRLYFRTYDDKPNLHPPADKSDWFKLESVDLGNGPFLGTSGDSMGVVTHWQWPDPTAGITGADFDKVAAVIKRGTPECGKWRENAQAKAWVGHAVAEALKLNVNNKSERSKAASLVKFWLSTKALRIFEGQDEKRETRKFVEVAEEAD